MARILYEETGVGAVAITDREKLLASSASARITTCRAPPSTRPTPARRSSTTRWSMPTATSFPTAATCIPSAGSALLVIPLRGGRGLRGGHHQALRAQAQVLLLHQPHPGRGIARLLSGQILAGKYNEQKRLLAQSEIAVAGADQPALPVQRPQHPGGGDPARPEDARTWCTTSTFFRGNLKRQGTG